ncbi:MAG TPA: hypothetical protein VE961_13585 [Pyrinomonadaceae bacterium]|nr:hypothetical protein [Pyrinomonadaceae bacterium]
MNVPDSLRLRITFKIDVLLTEDETVMSFRFLVCDLAVGGVTHPYAHRIVCAFDALRVIDHIPEDVISDYPGRSNMYTRSDSDSIIACFTVKR